jgi:hypothetical protein|tara:strand:- start:1178 stop:1294 length:117 start_codon:yes stop_codon:yes gene_type:complete
MVAGEKGKWSEIVKETEETDETEESEDRLILFCFLWFF